MPAASNLVDPPLKQLLRFAWRAALGTQSVLSIPFSGPGEQPRVFYGGARSGNMGGPLVKVKRLQEYFPEHRLRYNLVYLLSNTPYLPAFALSLLKSRRVPMVHNQNGVFYPGWYAGDWQAQNARMAISYRMADYVFFQSEFCRRSAEHFLGPRAGNGEILYNAVDTQRFRPAATKEKGPFVFLVTGKLDAHLFYRIESTVLGLSYARQHGLDARLVIAGWVAADAQARAEQLAADCGIGAHIQFSGPYTQENAPAIYGAADAYVMTKHNDPCPNTVLEALACGLPILYSASGGVPELAGTDAGVALACAESWDEPKVPDGEAIGVGMLEIARMQRSMAEAARRRAVERFDMAHWIRRHDEVFRQLLKEKSSLA